MVVAQGPRGNTGPIRQATHHIPQADFLAVRAGLQCLMAQEPLRSLPDDARGTAEIVLAEALNNIVEHAYAAHGGAIEIMVCLQDNAIFCTILDNGAPMPSHKLPQGKAHQLSDVHNLPEGGFGWFLIRALAQDLQYQRQRDQNFFSFRLPTQTLAA
jgi:serine/threonine-protein kinase RsbW